MTYMPAPLHQLPFSKKICENDWMYRGKSSYGYFMRGYEALMCIVNISRTAELSPKRILDFGCGHGCVSRMLKAHYQKADIIGQDVNNDWLKWCEDNLRIQTVLSDIHIRSASVQPDAFDLIWVGSVFTHIPEESFDYLLGILVDGLKPGGVLIFTAAGIRVRQSFDVDNERLLRAEDAMRAATQFDQNGYGFAPYDGGTYPDWGRAMVNVTNVTKKLQGFPVRLISFLEGGWGRRQDVYAVQRLGAGP